MDDLISRQNAIDAMIMLGAKKAVAVLESLPSVELERNIGKWIDEKINSYTSKTYCSECGLSALFIYKSDDYYGNHAYGETVKTKFCPNCGADMREEDIPIEYFENGGK